MDMYVVYIYVSWIKAYLYSLGIFFFLSFTIVDVSFINENS